MKYLGLLATAALVGCASLPPPIHGDAALNTCRGDYLALDRRTAAANVRDGGAHAVESFPYLRSNRFFASFRLEAEDGAPFDTWVERMRQLDLDARKIELRNVNEPVPTALLAQLDRCGREWATRDLKDAARREELRRNSAVPDDYSAARRLFGIYPAAVPFLKLGIGGYQDEVRADYARPLKSLDSPGPLVLWKSAKGKVVSAAQAVSWIRKSRDPLGVPRLSDEQWRQLAAAHAPNWWVETFGEFDRPGAPMHSASGPALDTQRPVTYFLSSYTRFGKQVLPQLVYVLWFSERPQQDLIDSYAGALDGVVWRVTLGADGRPLLYDTIHPCGCYHQIFAYRRLARDADPDFWEEPLLMPQPKMPSRPFAIRLQSGTHFVRRLAPLNQARATQTKSYELGDYRELLSLPGAMGTRRSLFGEDGIADGTERFERFWLWPAGVVSPGAMRQAGRQATAFVGRRHFDDPFLLDELFQ